MENFGNRLKEERERLGFSQAKFAEACGVGKTAQFNYESNARMPDGDYLHAAGELGVDTGYLLFSNRSTPNSLYSLGAANVLPFIAEKAGLNCGALLWILDQAAASEAVHWGGASGLSGAGPDLEQADLLYLVEELFSAGDLLESVITNVGTRLHTTGVSLNSDKQYALIMMLYRSFKLTGKIDQVMIEDAVKLATSS